MSRAIEGRMIFGSEEKERFVRVMRAIEGFTGVDVLTYTMLDNHFHCLLYVPERQEVNDEVFVRRLKYIYDQRRVDRIERKLRRLRQEKRNDDVAELKAKYTYRMYELSEFMKTLKQRVSQSYNKRHNRKGTIWEERFKSILIQPVSHCYNGERHPLAAVCAYIDLNAVRAGIVTDPKGYRFCGYAEAVAGSELARSGIGAVMLSLGRSAEWQAAVHEYRKLLYLKEGVGKQFAPVPESSKSSPRDSHMGIERTQESAPLPELLRRRVPQFSDGVALGNREFVRQAFSRHGITLGMTRYSGPHEVAVGGDCSLCTLRRPRSL